MTGFVGLFVAQIIFEASNRQTFKLLPKAKTLSKKRMESISVRLSGRLLLRPAPKNKNAGETHFLIKMGKEKTTRLHEVQYGKKLRCFSDR